MLPEDVHALIRLPSSRGCVACGQALDKPAQAGARCGRQCGSEPRTPAIRAEGACGVCGEERDAELRYPVLLRSLALGFEERIGVITALSQSI